MYTQISHPEDVLRLVITARTVLQPELYWSQTVSDPEVAAEMFCHAVHAAGPGGAALAGAAAPVSSAMAAAEVAAAATTPPFPISFIFPRFWGLGGAAVERVDEVPDERRRPYDTFTSAR
ncbi:hypothetical protein [Actinoallomurus soli]|uniref:hypothetical protein n=1 Tax=Actinoallomurus soli TaxID=2952535 RepID=UPI00209239E6|nr:hypothetical protein [Actinoallomurus soli]MCO5973702.1 hypothetical protein [Actinoallomurus soli]